MKNDTSFEDVKKFINNLAYQYQVSSEVEQWIDNPLVSGSIPLPGTILKHIEDKQEQVRNWSPRLVCFNMVIWGISIVGKTPRLHRGVIGSMPLSSTKEFGLLVYRLV